MRPIVFFTSNRSEWGLLEPLVDESFKRYPMKIIACSSHLSPIYNTAKQIKHDFERIECLLSSDTKEGCCKSAAVLMMSLTDVFKRLDPELVIILGDRYESMICAMTCHIMGIKILHLHGGERSGNIDDVFRDCISMMSDIHCCATEKAENNIRRILHNESSIFHMYSIYNVGALGCHNLPKKVDSKISTILICYHPNTKDEENFDEILTALEKFCFRSYKASNKYRLVFVFANNDFGGIRINKQIENFFNRYHDEIRMEISIDQNRKDYLELLSQSKVIIGNSSSGIIEAPAIGVPTINIGSRQKNRERSSSIIDVECQYKDIYDVLIQLEGNNFEVGFSYVPYQCKEDPINKIIAIIDREVIA